MNLSQAMQQLIIRVLDYPEALTAFIEAGGLELALEKLTACHQVCYTSHFVPLFTIHFITSIVHLR